MYINEAVELGAENFPAYRRAWENDQGNPSQVVANLLGGGSLILCTREGRAEYTPTVSDLVSGDWVLFMGKQPVHALVQEALSC